MDDRRFDAWTRSLATGLSRRNVLKGLFGGAVLGGAAATRVEEAAADHCTAAGTFHCDTTGECCVTATENCCGAAGCCPSNLCNQIDGVCCDETDFPCGTGDNACCDTETEKCCDGVCIASNLCCQSLGDCTAQGGFCCATGQLCSECCEDANCGPCEFCNQGTCGLLCGEEQLCCEVVGAAASCAEECCDVTDCVAPADSCIIVSCESGFCVFNTIVCDVCEACDTGQCVSTCPAGETCCPSGCEDLQNDPTNCGECAADCSAGLVCCAGDCLECCGTDDCDPCEICESAVCVPVVCEDPCAVCDPGVNQCVGLCPTNQICCISGPPEDQSITCVDECCNNEDCNTFETCETCLDGTCQRACMGDDKCCITGTIEDISIECVPECCEHEDCDDCHVCNVDGVCEPGVILCEAGLQACCVEGVLVCQECCGHADCDECEICHEGRCVFDEECCPRFGEPCGLIINGTTIAEGDPDDCCPGLVCCEFGHDRVCVECCDDRHCDKDECCCEDGTCSRHCCDRKCEHDKDCPHGKCCCHDGTCSEHCCDRKCEHDKDCPHGTCCCKDGSCSKDCCPSKGCRHDKDCPHGKCCCDDGSCSADCCETPTTKPPSGGTIDTLPNTGIGGDDTGAGWLGAAALGAAAAYVAGKKLREGHAPETVPADEE